MNRRKALSSIAWSALAVPLASGCVKIETRSAGSDAEEEGAGDDGLVDLLFVQEARGVRFDGDSMTLVGFVPRTLYFADRPDEIAGYLAFPEFMDLVSNGPQSFEESPPNATLVVMGGAEPVNVVMRLSAKPHLDDADLVFPAIHVIAGEPPAEGTQVALFIDTIGRPMSPGSVAGVHRREKRRHRRRAVH